MGGKYWVWVRLGVGVELEVGVYMPRNQFSLSPVWTGICSVCGGIDPGCRRCNCIAQAVSEIGASI